MGSVTLKMKVKVKSRSNIDVVLKLKGNEWGMKIFGFRDLEKEGQGEIKVKYVN